jgi:histidyl-tRNA synthetase
MSQSKKQQRVKARLSRGLNDLMSQQQLAREWMFSRIRGVYESYGFLPLSTPAVEYLDVLLGSDAGDEASKQIFTVSNPEGEELGLRFDLTVPLARVVAQYRELERPFRRYQVAPVWRGDKPDKGRFREFTQFDIDSVGTKSEVADAEILAAGCDIFDALGIEKYLIRYSSRALLDVLLVYAGISPELGRDVFRVLDKLDKAGLDKVKLELTRGYKDESGDTIRGVGLEDAQVAKIEEYLTLRADKRQEVVDRLRVLFAGARGADAAIATVETMSNHLHALGYSDDRVQIDLSIARGLAYYTGPIFEAVLLDAPQFGSVFAGGRYDGLVKRFSGEEVPAVGGSIGVDRLLAALGHLGKVRTRKSTSQVLVTVLDPSMESDYVALTWQLRREGIPCEMYLGNAKRGLGKQLKYGDSLEIPIALILGEDEKAQGIVQIKDMDAGRRLTEEIEDRDEWLARRPGQREVARENLVDELKALLKTIDADARGFQA